VLKLEKVILSDNLDKVTARAEESERAIRKLNTGKASLEDALSMGQTSRHGLGYDKFMMERAKASAGMSTVDHALTRRVKRCSYCDHEGHVKNRCYRLVKDMLKDNRSHNLRSSVMQKSDR
jgi:hypothetical protein